MKAPVSVRRKPVCWSSGYPNKDTINRGNLRVGAFGMNIPLNGRTGLLDLSPIGASLAQLLLCGDSPGSGSTRTPSPQGWTLRRRLFSGFWRFFSVAKGQARDL